MRLLLTGSGLPWGGQGGRTVGGDENGHTDEREQPLLFTKTVLFSKVVVHRCRREGEKVTLCV